MPVNRRHTEFFGPDLARGPVLSGSPQTAAVQLAAALAQIRFPLLRADADIEAHADFVRGLADRLMPDWAAAIKMDVNTVSAGTIETTIRTDISVHSLLHCWLADSVGGGLTGTTATTITWNIGTVIQEIVARKHYLILVPDTGVAKVTVTYGSSHDWNWAVSRYGRVYYSPELQF
jgi:hypothetical protein